MSTNSLFSNHATEEFYNEFKQGIDLYLAGEWLQAKVCLESANKMMSKVPGMPGDGPSLTLIRYIDEHGGKAPDSWAGFRPLTSK